MLSDVYFEAMEYHQLEQKNRIEKYGKDYEGWASTNVDTFEFIQKKVKLGLHLNQEEIEFLLNHTAANIHNHAVTADEFFSHHFDNVARRQKEFELKTKQEKAIKIQKEFIDELMSTDFNYFSANRVLIGLRTKAGIAKQEVRRYV